SLMLAFELQEEVIATNAPIRIATAHIRSSLIHRTTPFVAVEEAADRFIDVIALMAQNLLVRVLGLIAVREALLGRLETDPEVLRAPGDVVVAHLNTGVTATVARPLWTVVARLHGVLGGLRRSDSVPAPSNDRSAAQLQKRERESMSIVRRMILAVELYPVLAHELREARVAFDIGVHSGQVEPVRPRPQPSQHP